MSARIPDADSENAFGHDLEIPNEKTKAAIAEVENGQVKRFDSVEALMADLNDAGD